MPLVEACTNNPAWVTLDARKYALVVLDLCREVRRRGLLQVEVHKVVGGMFPKAQQPCLVK